MSSVPQMDEDAQRLYVNAMLSHPELFAKVNHILKPAYFDGQLAKGVKFVQEYFQENRVVPAASIFTVATKVPTSDPGLTHGDIEPLARELAEFCRYQACIEVMRKSTGVDGYFEKGDLGRMVAEMKAASELGLIVDLGIDYFDNPEQRIEDYEKDDPVISTGWTSVDDVIGGGVGKQELIMFLAPSGGGKSISMLNLAVNWLEMGMFGAYISLEMRGLKVALRADAMIGRILTGKVNANKEQVAHAIMKLKQRTGCDFQIKRMREGTTNANDISAFLNQLKTARKRKLDFVIVDYLDIMAAVQKGAGDSMFLKDKFVAEEVRALGFDQDCIMVSASQLGKHATADIEEGRKMHQGDVQGGSSKTNTSDLMIATVKTDAMHEAGEYRFEFPKARNSDAGTKQVTMNWNKSTLRISDMGAKLQLNKKRPGMDIIENKIGAKRLGLDDLSNKFQEPT